MYFNVYLEYKARLLRGDKTSYLSTNVYLFGINHLLQLLNNTNLQSRVAWLHQQLRCRTLRAMIMEAWCFLGAEGLLQQTEINVCGGVIDSQ